MEIGFRSLTGYLRLAEIAGDEYELPSLPAGHGDYRLRYHLHGERCLLQVWPAAARPPVALKRTSALARAGMVR